MKRILTIIFILSSFVTLGQWTPMTAWGYTIKRLKIDSLVLPTDTTNNKTGIAQIGSNLFTGNGVSWAAIGGIDTTSLSNRINLRVKYTDTASMLDAYRTAINTKVTTGSEAELTGVKAASSAGFTIKANSGSTVATFGAGGGINANIANLSIGTAIAFNGRRLADTTDLAPFATTTSVNTALGLKLDKTAFIDSLISRNAARTNIINSFSTRQNFTSIYANKDSIPITTGRIWGVFLDTANNRLVRQTISAGISGSGAANQIAFWNGTSSQTGGNNFTFNGNNIAQIVGAFVATNNNRWAAYSISNDGAFIEAFTNSSFTSRGDVLINPNGGKIGIGTYLNQLQNSNNRVIVSGGTEIISAASQSILFRYQLENDLSFIRNANSTGSFTNINFSLFNSSSQVRAYSSITSGIESPTAGSENGFFAINTITSGTSTRKLQVNSLGNVLIQTGGTFTDNGAKLQVAGNISLTTAGNKLLVAEGSNASIGTATLSSGTVTVNTTAVTASSIIMLTVQETGTNNGRIRVSARVANTSFTISSSDAGDNCVVAYQIIN